jgi:DNA-binding transcriptional ArsR family regulator
MQEILEVPQVKMSKQLSLMKQLGLLDAHREGTWMIYKLVEPVEGLITANLCYLREATYTECNQLQCDLKKRKKLILKVTKIENDCPQEVCEQIACC